MDDNNIDNKKNPEKDNPKSKKLSNFTVFVLCLIPIIVILALTHFGVFLKDQLSQLLESDGFIQFINRINGYTDIYGEFGYYGDGYTYVVEFDKNGSAIWKQSQRVFSGSWEYYKDSDKYVLTVNGSGLYATTVFEIQLKEDVDFGSKLIVNGGVFSDSEFVCMEKSIYVNDEPQSVKDTTLLIIKDMRALNGQINILSRFENLKQLVFGAAFSMDCLSKRYFAGADFLSERLSDLNNVEELALTKVKIVEPNERGYALFSDEYVTMQYFTDEDIEKIEKNLPSTVKVYVKQFYYTTKDLLNYTNM